MKRRIRVVTAEKAAAEKAKIADKYPVRKRQPNYEKEKKLYEDLEVGGFFEVSVPEGVEADKYATRLTTSLERKFKGLVVVDLSFDGKVVRVTKLAPVPEDEFEDEIEDQSNNREKSEA
jgi:hypothetical protein